MYDSKFISKVTLIFYLGFVIFNGLSLQNSNNFYSINQRKRGIYDGESEGRRKGGNGEKDTHCVSM